MNAQATDLKNGASQDHANRMRLKCPTCGAKAYIRHSYPASETVRDIYTQCTNISCGETHKRQMVVLYYISPSALDERDKQVHLPPTPDGENVPDFGKPQQQSNSNQLTMFTTD